MEDDANQGEKTIKEGDDVSDNVNPPVEKPKVIFFGVPKSDRASDNNKGNQLSSEPSKRSSNRDSKSNNVPIYGKNSPSRQSVNSAGVRNSMQSMNSQQKKLVFFGVTT